MSHLVLAFFVSAVATLFVVRSSRTHGHLSADTDLSGPQKFHSHPVPRIGGVGLYVGLFVCALILWWQGASDAKLGFLLLACGLPAFGAGLIEDLTKAVSPAKRLAATALSAALAAWFIGAQITRTDIPGLDWLVATGAGAMVATVFTVAGVANSVNIIDGFNGLSSMCVKLM